MISNRRRPVPKGVENEATIINPQPLADGKPPLPARKNPPPYIKQINTQTPEMPATEMFINENVTSPLTPGQRLNHSPSVVQNQFVEENQLSGKIFTRRKSSLTSTPK